MSIRGRSALTNSSSELDRAHNRPPEVPRIYHYPTKWNRTAPTSTTTSTDNGNYFDVPQQDNNLSGSSSSSSSQSKSGKSGKSGSRWNPFQQVKTFVSSVGPRGPATPSSGWKQRVAGYKWFLLVPLLLVVLAATRDYWPVPLPAPSRVESQLEKIIDIGELKEYIRNFAQQYAAEANKDLQKSHKSLEKFTYSLQEELRGAINAIDVIKNDQKSIKLKDEAQLKGLQEELTKLDVRLTELKGLRPSGDSWQPTELHQLKADLLDLRHYTEQKVTAKPDLTSEIEKIKDEVLAEVLKTLPRLPNTPQETEDRPQDVSSEQVIQEIQKQLLKYNRELKDTILTDIEKKIISEIEDKIKAGGQERVEIEEKLKAEDKNIKAEMDSMNEQIRSIRETVSSSEISPQFSDLVKRLVKEYAPDPQSSNPPIDENAVKNLIEDALKELIKKVESLSQGLSSLDTTVGTVKQETVDQLLTKEKDIVAQIDELISQKLLSTPDASDSYVGQLEKLKSTILSEVKRMFARYDADKIGRVDWALSSIGAQIVSTLTSNTYTLATEQSLFNNMWSFFSPPAQGFQPSAVLSRDTTAGHCWAFKGSSGKVAIKLPEPYTPILVTHVTLDHIDARTAPNIPSAPKDCVVWGFTNETAVPQELGRFSYDITSSEAIQTFSLQHPGQFPIIMVEVLTNHGFDDYTCIYRIRIHGDRIQGQQ